MSATEEILGNAAYITPISGIGTGRVNTGATTFVFIETRDSERERGVSFSEQPLARGESLTTAIVRKPRNVQVTITVTDDARPIDLGAGFVVQGQSVGGVSLVTAKEQAEYLENLDGAEVEYSSRTLDDFQGFVSNIEVREDNEYSNLAHVTLTITRPFIQRESGAGRLRVEEVLIPNTAFDPVTADDNFDDFVGPPVPKHLLGPVSTKVNCDTPPVDRDPNSAIPPILRPIVAVERARQVVTRRALETDTVQGVLDGLARIGVGSWVITREATKRAINVAVSTRNQTKDDCYPTRRVGGNLVLL